MTDIFNLADPSLTIADIAEKVGYTDLANFSRVFRRLTGISANEYRNQIIWRIRKE